MFKQITEHPFVGCSVFLKLSFLSLNHDLFALEDVEALGGGCVVQAASVKGVPYAGQFDGLVGLYLADARGFVGRFVLGQPLGVKLAVLSGVKS